VEVVVAAVKVLDKMEAITLAVMAVTEQVHFLHGHLQPALE
jgi:hypothetical protein